MADVFYIGHSYVSSLADHLQNFCPSPLGPDTAANLTGISDHFGHLLSVSSAILDLAKELTTLGVRRAVVFGPLLRTANLSVSRPSMLSAISKVGWRFAFHHPFMCSCCHFRLEGGYHIHNFYIILLLF